MSKKHRLMTARFRAGVAMPVLTLSLLWQPALAAPVAPGALAVPSRGHVTAPDNVIRVQEQPAAEQPILPPDAAPAQEEAPAQAERPRREQAPEAPAEAEPQAEQPSAREPQRREAPAASDATSGTSSEAAPSEAPAERPQRPARSQNGGADASESQSGTERPRGERPRGEGQPGEGRPQGERPRRDRPTEGSQPDAQQPGTQQRGNRSAEQPAAEDTAPAGRPARSGEGRAPAAGEAPAARPGRPAAPSDAAPGTAAPNTVTPDAATPPDAAAPAAPGRPAAPPASQRAPADPSQTLAPAPSDPSSASGQPGAAPVAPGTPASGTPASGTPAPGTPAAAAAGAETAAPPAGPRTPEEIERAKAVAKDPSSATGPVVLPVENGAAVLDSAKEYPSAPAAAPNAAPGAPASAGRPRGPREGGQPAAAAPAGPPPTSDAEAQALAPGERPRAPIRMEAATAERGERLDGRPRFERPEGFRERGGERDGSRVILQFDNRTIVRHDDSRRFYDEGYEPEYERLRGGRTREIIERDNGVRIVTIRNRYGDVVQRSRIGDDGREYVLYYAPELIEEREQPRRWRDPGLDLPPMRLTVPLDDYIIDTSSEPDRDYYEFLEQPPVERVERVYSLDEVRYSARIRDKVRRIDLDTVTFATGSAEIPMNQASSLRKVAQAIKDVLDRDPAETFLIEGHTDAVGSDDSNLVLSDERAESVARVLTDAFDIPPENLATQGYGERYLKVRTDGPSQENRRVTIRRITPLVKPVAQK
ncbi:OmpA family protein [Neorhizobium sp. NPDC001467]|uniref:OmpA family protein n=1 Tax=Neorhizobium sp. NPDC001467 TaxID=3390595 RepID=UPI003CFF3C34